MSTSHSVLVTGASGFVGGFLCSRLVAEQCMVRGTLLPAERTASLADGVESVTVQPLAGDTTWAHALTGIDTVIHLAARVHIMADSIANPLAEFRKVNVEGTVQLAKESVRAGVKRFVFVSSIKVNGEETLVPYTEQSPAQPTDPYGISKWEAEQALRRIEKETELEVVVVRPPLVYGAGVKANFYNLMKVVMRRIPLPLALIHNRRSLIYVRNLADALACSARHPAAAGRTYLVSDEEVVSTSDLISRIAAAMGVSPRLFPVPASVLRLAGTVTGKSSAVDRLLGSLVVDASAIRTELGWSAPFTMDEGLRETVGWYLKTHSRNFSGA